jgi:hypothetical protein
MRKDNDFKTEVDGQVRRGSYVFSKVSIRVFFCTVILIVLSLVALFGVKLWQNYADRVAFKQSLAFIEVKVDDLADYKLQMLRAKSDIEKSAISDTIVQRFANFDISNIEDSELRQFLKDCRNGKYIINGDITNEKD